PLRGRAASTCTRAARRSGRARPPPPPRAERAPPPPQRRPTGSIRGPAAPVRRAAQSHQTSRPASDPRPCVSRRFNSCTMSLAFMPADGLFAGVFSVLPTPFGPTGEVDHESLQRVVDLFIGGGINGVTALGVTSEVARLT